MAPEYQRLVVYPHGRARVCHLKGLGVDLTACGGRVGAAALPRQDRGMPIISRRLAAQRKREQLEARRLRAAALLGAGVRQAEVARQIGVSRQLGVSAKASATGTPVGGLIGSTPRGRSYRPCHERAIHSDPLRSRADNRGQHQ